MEPFTPQLQLESQKSKTWMVIVVIVILLIIAGIVYYIRVQSTPSTNVSPQAEQSQDASQNVNSDEVSSIESDLNATDVSNLDNEIPNIEKELNTLITQ